eukprot:6137109-Prymnesium_polylepis.1
MATSPSHCRAGCHEVHASGQLKGACAANWTDRLGGGGGGNMREEREGVAWHVGVRVAIKQHRGNVPGRLQIKLGAGCVHGSAVARAQQ